MTPILVVLLYWTLHTRLKPSKDEGNDVRSVKNKIAAYKKNREYKIARFEEREAERPNVVQEVNPQKNANSYQPTQQHVALPKAHKKVWGTLLTKQDKNKKHTEKKSSLAHHLSFSPKEPPVSQIIFLDLKVKTTDVNAKSD